MDFNSPDFEELYQSIILDHSRKPRNFGELPEASVTASGDNPSCGDAITLQLRFDPADAQKLAEVKFHGDGCSICMASASMMTTKIKGRTRNEAEALRGSFQSMLTLNHGSADEAAPPPPKELGDLRLLQGVRKFPQRIKCATLAWHALHQALSEDAAKRVTFDIEGKGQPAR
ncbi:MAG: SUF system NifU family Fe-S cluster assembly protein [Verrucomicrobia bacterium]|nr:SUF system NifU family Fe-S cluster assembly protein [Verrucomicrobiota bacterium]MBV9656831.1 SUF system NifU family Fe-S cluster assembly protein [Verrucomicrobiota bacterium]